MIEDPTHPDFHDGWSAIRERHLPLVAPAPGPSDIVVTHQDKRRLEHLLCAPHWHSATPRETAALRQGLAAAATVRPQVMPPDVVTMKSRVICQDTVSGARTELQLVYPWEARARKACLSILSDLGMSILGRSVGEPIELPKDARWRPSLRLAAIRYQPEREGHYHL
jgi:regulator of nucleoside diphosphate kinase